MNSKGVMHIVFFGLMGCMIIAATFLRPSHIIRRANEKCVHEIGDAAYCEEKVTNMTQEERIEYIRDI